MITSRLFLIALTPFLTLPLLNHAQSTDWSRSDAAGSGNWFESGNWDNGVPDSSLRANVTNGGSAEIASGNATANWLQIEGGSSVAISGSSTLDITNASNAGAAKIRIGVSSTGTFSVSGDAEVNSFDSSLGQLRAGSGTVNMSGGSWTLESEFIIGREGLGTLNLTGGEIIAAPNQAGGISMAQFATSTGILNIGTGASAGILNTKFVQGQSGTAIVNFNHSEANYQLTKDGTASGDSIQLKGTLAINHIGSGTTTISGGGKTYEGDTTISNGILQINSTLTNSAAFVENGGTLAGTGTLQQGITLESGGVVAPGTSSGATLSASTLSWGAGGVLAFELGSGDSDFLDLSGDLTKLGSGDYQFDFSGSDLTDGQTYSLLGFGGNTDFISDDFSFANTNGFDGDFAFDGMTLQFTAVAVPEPSIFAFGVAGLIAILMVRRRHSGVAHSQ